MKEVLQKKPESAEKPRRHVSQIAVIDFDRTLGDVEASMARFYNTASSFGINQELVRNAQAATENDGGTFEPLSYIKSSLEPDDYESFKEEFITVDGPPIMYPEAQNFLDMLQENTMPFVVRTWGVSAEWQDLKLAAAGYTGSYEVISTKDKGAEINSWRQENVDGSSVIVVPSGSTDREVITADSAVLIDDKALSFTSLDSKDDGFWIVPSDGILMKSQQGTVPDNVQKASLDDLTVMNGEIVHKDDKLPIGMKYVTMLTDKHIDQLIAYSTDTEDEGVQNNTSDKKRFKDREAVLHWREKGRSTTIITNDEGDLLGLSWMGAEDIHVGESDLQTDFVIATETRETVRAFNPSQYGVTFAIRVYGEARGKGLSSRLTKRAERQFKKTDAYKALLVDGKIHPWLEVSAENTPAVRSYRKSGYVEATAPNDDGKILMIQKAERSPVTIFNQSQ
jgi:ribosomal protein S18 acetylase RimI-like enzyme